MDYRESEKLVNSYAWKTFRRMQRAGINSFSLDDLRQEMWCAWCKARDSFDPSHEVPFLAYVAGGLKLHAMGLTQRQGYARIDEEWAKSLSSPVGEDGDTTLGDLVPSADPSQEEKLAEQQALDFVENNLSDRARLFMRLLREQPAELLEEVHKAEKRAEWAAELNVRNMHFVGLTTGVVFKVMGASRPERTEILAEVRKLEKVMMERA